MRRILFFLFILGLTVFAVFDCMPSTGTYGFIDYINILLCNTKQYPLYGRSIWQLTNILFYFVIMNTGIYFLSESHCNFSKGFRSLVLVRYGKVRKYFFHIVHFSFVETVKYLAYLLANCALVLAFIDTKALFSSSSRYSAPAIENGGFLLLYCLKIVLFFVLIQVLISYLLIRLKYEPLLAISIIGTSILLYIDVTFRTNFITLSLDGSEIIYICIYGVMLLLAGMVISVTTKRKEL